MSKSMWRTVADTKAMVDQVLKEWGKVDILVNNAGITRDGLLLRMKEEIGSSAASKFERRSTARRRSCSR